MLAHSFLTRCIMGCATVVAVAAPTMAVVVSTPVDTTAPPEADFGWSNLGTFDNATAIYLGNRWVITAAHLSDTVVEFPDVGVFQVDSSSVFRIDNTADSGLTKPTDVKLFQLKQDPGLPPLDILDVTPDVGTEVWVAGHGLETDRDLTYWDVSQRGARWVWTETGPPGEYSGLVTSGPGIMRWGTNLIEDDESFKNEFDTDILAKLVTTTTETLTLLTEFDDDSSNSDDDVRGVDGSAMTAYESQAVLNDSGGGMFVRVGDQWKLAGTILSVEGHRDQPDVTRHAIFGNLTFYADLATSGDQIRSRVIYGDLNQDLALSVADVDALIEQINSPTPSLSFDLNRDRTVTDLDLHLLIGDVFETTAGDANLDGRFDTSDLIAVFQTGQYEDTVAGNSTWASGDWNGDLEFDSQDFLLALQTGGFETQLTSALATHVPEPSASILIALALLGIIPRRARRDF